jgi:hypothetical protein
MKTIRKTIKKNTLEELDDSINLESDNGYFPVGDIKITNDGYIQILEKTIMSNILSQGDFIINRDITSSTIKIKHDPSETIVLTKTRFGVTEIEIENRIIVERLINNRQFKEWLIIEILNNLQDEYKSVFHLCQGENIVDGSREDCNICNNNESINLDMYYDDAKKYNKFLKEKKAKGKNK